MNHYLSRHAARRLRELRGLTAVPWALFWLSFGTIAGFVVGYTAAQARPVIERMMGW